MFTFAFLLVTVVVQQSIGHLEELDTFAPILVKVRYFCTHIFVCCFLALTSDMERRGDLGSPGGRGCMGRTIGECCRVEGREREMLIGSAGEEIDELLIEEMFSWEEIDE